MADIIEFPHNDLVVQMMPRYNIPMTRENYLQIAYGGDLPDPWTAAHEDELPAPLQDWSKVYFVPVGGYAGCPRACFVGVKRLVCAKPARRPGNLCAPMRQHGGTARRCSAASLVSLEHCKACRQNRTRRA
jgi:hypothetical protein